MNIVIDTREQVLSVKDDRAFDIELLGTINQCVATLYQLGVDEFDGFIVELETEYPDLTPRLKQFVRQYIVTKTRIIFDPTSSDTIARARQSVVEELEQRIMLEVEEIAAAELLLEEEL